MMERLCLRLTQHKRFVPYGTLELLSAFCLPMGNPEPEFVVEATHVLVTVGRHP